MATISSIKAKIQGLIDKSNEATGGSDTDLTTAIDSLIANQGGGSGELEILPNVALTFPAGRYNICNKYISDGDIKYQFFPAFILTNQISVSLKNIPVGSEIYFANTKSGAPNVNVTVTGDFKVLYGTSSGVLVEVTGPTSGTITIADA